ncbi:MAG: hypothetical protein J0M12_10655 [Deltaproteobacteria bacterium]|nr:hypothetical protein [Deltaproteobacteria bacterium]
MRSHVFSSAEMLRRLTYIAVFITELAFLRVPASAQENLVLRCQDRGVRKLEVSCSGSKIRIRPATPKTIVRKWKMMNKAALSSLGFSPVGSKRCLRKVRKGCAEVLPTPSPTPSPQPTATTVPTAVPGSFATSLTQYGVTFTFSQSTRYGQFVNGDYWVLGPVTIVAISPDFTGTRHGFEVNPASKVNQGFDSRAISFDAARVPLLPLQISTASSVVKSISVDPNASTCRPCLQTAAVLTVLMEVPPQEGALTFRPGYFGNSKTLFSAASLNLASIPALTPVASVPSLSSVATGLQRLQLDHQENWVGRYLHPVDNGPDYGSSIATRNNEALLRVMLNDSIEQKAPAITYLVQYGIDIWSMYQGGVRWPTNGGHTLGRLPVLAFAAVLLDNSQMKSAVQNVASTDFDETYGTYYSSTASKVIYGQTLASEMGYWDNLVRDNNSRTQRDPYGYIDGGYRPGGSYQYCCISQPYKGSALAIEMMATIKSIWPNPHLLTYAARWVSDGAHTQPDPCAPADGLCSGGTRNGLACTSANEDTACPGGLCELDWGHYGVTYGPNGSGGCILDTDPSDGTGRFPALHGTSADAGNYGSAFIDQMWLAHMP